MQHAWFFGYGSLVNRLTHEYVQAHPARVRGWRRAWRYTHSFERTFLTAIPDPQAEIDGLIAAVPGGDWNALDAREAGYDRHHLAAPDLVQRTTDAIAAQIYAIAPDRSSLPGPTHPIKLSYLDVVVQGYLREFGEAGACDFFASTDGWETPVLDDRKAPLYARAQVLGPSERGFVDDQLRALGATVLRS